jgi:hypothetical protein
MESLVWNRVIPLETKTTLTEELAHCDREIAAAREALLAGSAPLLDALLWYTDWCWERELLRLASNRASSFIACQCAYSLSNRETH